MIEDHKTAVLMIKNGKQSSNQKRLLAINFGGIGDEILFLPTLRTIKKYCPEYAITLLLEPRSRSVQELTGLLADTITFDIKKRPLLVQDLVELLALIKSGGYDAVVSSGSSPLVAALLFLSGVPIRVGYYANRLSPFLLTQPVQLNRKQYAAYMYHDLAVGFLRTQGMTPQALPEEALIPEVSLKAESQERMQIFLRENGISEGRFILVHPGTSRLATIKGIIKTWSTNNWLELLSLIERNNEGLSKEDRIPVVLAGGPDDKEIIAELLAGLSTPSYLVSAYGQTKNLADLAALVSYAALVVCVDSAPMHVTVGLNQPLVALFGPTDPNLLLPRTSRFRFVWDSREGTRSMFDGLGVEISVQSIFDAILASRALPDGKNLAERPV